MKCYFSTHIDHVSVSPSNAIGPVRYKVKVKSLYLTSVVTSVTKLV